MRGRIEIVALAYGILDVVMAAASLVLRELLTFMVSLGRES